MNKLENNFNCSIEVLITVIQSRIEKIWNKKFTKTS